MRTTIRLDDDLADAVKKLALEANVSFDNMLNRLLRAGLADNETARSSERRFMQRTCNLGQPAFDVDKALAFAASLEDEATLRKLAQRR